MTNIYIDTNIFLNFYQSAHERVSIFSEIETYSDSIIFTEQTVNEFKRNKNLCLNRLLKEVKNTKFNMYNTSVIHSLPQYKHWTELQNSSKKLVDEMHNQLSVWLKDESSDPVFSLFNLLVTKSTLYSTTNSNIEKAKLRKLLGNPPTSSDKHTIGDELIWETLLTSSKDNLIIVTRDHTFHENESILKEEFFEKTNYKLTHIFQKLSDALTEIGKKSENIEKEEEKIKDSFDFISKFNNNDKCPICGGKIVNIGFESNDGESVTWLNCLDCGEDFLPLFHRPPN